MAQNVISQKRMDELLQQLETTLMKDTFKESWGKSFVVVHQTTTNYSLNQLALPRCHDRNLVPMAREEREGNCAAMILGDRLP
jgi:predicted nucleic acid-binding protein